jgi:ABC-type oligopeptide transport system substrate-binding subunit
LLAPRGGHGQINGQINSRIGSQVGSGKNIVKSDEKEQKILKMRHTGLPTTFDWTYAQTPEEGDVLVNVMEGLIELDESMQPQPSLAEKWQISSDGKTYKFTIRSGVQWSDGKPLLAKHFVLSWNRLKDPAKKGPYSNYLADVAQVSAPDDKTFIVQLKRTVPYFLELLGFWVTFPIREDMLRSNVWRTPTQIPVLGPYVVSQVEKNTVTTLSYNPRYWGKKPAVLHVKLIVEPDEIKARTLFDTGQVDLILDANQLDLLRLGVSENGQSMYQKFKYFAITYLGFNHRSGAGKNVNFRKAMAYAIDRTKLVSDLGVGGQEATSLVPPGLMGYEARQGQPFQLDHAKDNLEKAKSAGLAEFKPGANPLVMVVRKGPMAEIAKNVAAQLQSNLGLSILVRELVSDEYVSDMLNGRYDLAIARWGADFPDPATFMDLMRSQGNLSRTAWSNADYDNLVKNAGDTLDRAERAEYYRIAQRILLEEQVGIVPLFYPQTIALVSRKIRNLYIAPIRALHFKRIQMH